MKPYQQNQKKANRKRTLLLIVGLLLIALIAGLGIKAFMDRRSKQSSPTNEPTETINYEPATDAEKAQNDQHKESLGNQPEPTPPSGDKKTVTPIITDAGQYDDKVEVRAYVPGIVETGGKCTFTFKQGTAEVTRTVDGNPGPQATQCEPIGIPRSEFPSAGEWTLAVNYSSAKYNGASEPWKVQVK